MQLIREGELSRATRLLHSTGLGDLTDDRVVQQLRDKHPSRKAGLPPTLDAMGDFARVEVDLDATLRDLPKRAGTGVSGFRNEYLRALTEEFADERARSVIPLLNRFATAYANAELPSWYYYVMATTKMVAPVKEAARGPGEAPDVRPIGMGECLIRAIHTSLAESFKTALEGHLSPQQVAVGVESGISKLVFGIRLLAEANPSWAVVKLDLKNAFNEILRAAVLDRLNADQSIRSLVPVMWATYSPAAGIYLAAPDPTLAPFGSEEGMRQGCSLGSAGYCVGIHPEVRKLDEELRASGGGGKI